jgi:xylonate dehydratase
VNLVGETDNAVSADEGLQILSKREPRPDLTPDPSLPDDTRLWAALQEVSGGPWGGAVYDCDAILKVLAAGKRALATRS